MEKVYIAVPACAHSFAEAKTVPVTNQSGLENKNKTYKSVVSGRARAKPIDKVTWGVRPSA
eukprot:scaffold139623_cov16-Tisochrysis_lutea.AAC.1